MLKLSSFNVSCNEILYTIIFVVIICISRGVDKVYGWHDPFSLTNKVKLYFGSVNFT